MIHNERSDGNYTGRAQLPQSGRTVRRLWMNTSSLLNRIRFSYGRTMRHEIGHILGLWHPGVETIREWVSIMNPGVGTFVADRSDAAAGLNSLYRWNRAGD